ncbi:hypothetical protein [Nocardia brasiliensis]|uniref:hypothetical protein n=1 Tax=Nocardia brasiliensis TaxID=37326 RepID=UPI003672433A
MTMEQTNSIYPEANKFEAFVPPNEDPVHIRVHHLPEMSSEIPVWSYIQQHQYGSQRSYYGHVTDIHGTEALRLRNELADITRDLLDWAAQQQSDDQLIKDGKAA